MKNVRHRPSLISLRVILLSLTASTPPAVKIPEGEREREREREISNGRDEDGDDDDECGRPRSTYRQQLLVRRFAIPISLSREPVITGGTAAAVFRARGESVGTRWTPRYRRTRASSGRTVRARFYHGEVYA